MNVRFFTSISNAVVLFGALLVSSESTAGNYTPEALCNILSEFSGEARGLKELGASIATAKGSYEQLRQAEEKKRLYGLIILYDRVVDESFSSTESVADLKSRIYSECMDKKYTEQQVRSGEGI